ncbi:maleylpyruvate isomerase family mycothiol-dependent enzyme [Kutzneria sp. NPDC052558]|uniref:maleylpyruvate isomerase family mycothiol-dependent enzyme n=1 Tax=Kutzneria sp. NPDC052558 TaxID=3364121 RepID=UPI0037C7A0CE
MDYVPHFRREIAAFQDAIRRAGADGAPPVPSCPGWSTSDLLAHLGRVQRFVIHIIERRLAAPPDPADRAILNLPADTSGWPAPEHAPNQGPVPPGLVDWFADGASTLETLFSSRDPDEPVWTWSPEGTVGFWSRMQTIEAAVHRWDAENAIGAAQPIDGDLAADAIEHTFTVMAAFRRAQSEAPAGLGETLRFRRTDGPDVWTVQFDGDAVRLIDPTEPRHVELFGTASDLMLFLWRRIPADDLHGIVGTRAVLNRYFTLVPPM